MYADNDYPTGYVVGIIEGEVVGYDEATDFAIEPKPGLYIETLTPFKYVNHSCEPNIELVGERLVVALRPVTQGEELFFDYSTFIYDDWSLRCKCGLRACRGYINGKS